uniref:Uncharacterized protein n=1 Tax=Panagrolaimus sp. ES5 TaxID=591445 RepID=A0AC34G9Y2_9BILA
MCFKKGLIKFLAKSNENKASDVITRICGKQEKLPKRKIWRHLKIADPDTPRDIRPVPSNVPPLDVNEFDSDWSDDERAKESNEEENNTSESSEVYREPFIEKIGSADNLDNKKFSTSSSSSSSTISSSLNPNEKSLKETQKLAKNVFKIVHKVDKAVSPRSQPSSSRFSEQNSISLSGDRSEKVTSRYIPQSSKAIQTDFEIPVRPKTADVAVSARLSQLEVDGKSNSSVTTSLHQLIDKSSGETTTATSSSIFSSSLSAGEIPLHKVAQMTARSKYTVVSIRPDGSCSSAIANYQAFKETSKFYPSTPKTPTLIESRDELTSYHNSSFANLPPLKTSTPITKGTTTFGITKSPLPRGPLLYQWNKESDGDASSLRVHEHSLPTTSFQDNFNSSPKVEELTPKE